MRSRRLTKQVNKPIPESTKADPIGELRMDNQSYLILPEIRQNDHRFNLINSSKEFPEFDIAGELEIDQERYFIVRSEKEDRKESTQEVKSPAEILTKRELQIVMLVAEGRVNKQIAGQLRISEWTVSTHLRRIFAKLNVDSRAAMVYKCSSFI
jgi:DNA-binding CsgD family transcriptional regulator